MSKTPWVEFFPSDFLAGVSTLSAAERGVYISLICAMYEGKGRVKNDPRRLARLCGCDAKTFRSIAASLESIGKIETVDGEFFTNRKVVEIRKKSEKISATNREKARKRWEDEREKNEQNQQSHDATAYGGYMPDGMLDECPPQPQPQPQKKISLSEPSVREGSARNGGGEDEVFDNRTIITTESVLKASGLTGRVLFPVAARKVRDWLTRSEPESILIAVVRRTRHLTERGDPPVSLNAFDISVNAKAAPRADAASVLSGGASHG